jgi:hypothetical protein
MAVERSDAPEGAIGALFLAVQAAYHARGKHVGFVFRVGPKNIVAHLVVDQIDPAPRGVVFAAFLPIFRVNQVDLSGLVCLTGGSTPINILKPFYFRLLQVIKPAQQTYGFLEVGSFAFVEKGRQ